MNTQELLNSIDTEIATLQLATAQLKSVTTEPTEIVILMSKEIAYAECRNILLKHLIAKGS